MGSCADDIRALKQERGAVILAHTYQPDAVQDIADYVGDSYGLSVEATRVEAETIVFCGVMFMAETAAILNPSRTVIIPEPDAGCPMAEMIEPADLAELRAEHPDHLVMCYVNSTASIKAMSDVCCTSANALTIARKLPESQGIIFVPDEHLGDYISEMTGRDMVLWKGFCPTHVKITPDMLRRAREDHPEAVIMIHPEAPRESRHCADQVLSTGGMCRFVAESDREEFVVATEIGIVHTLRTRNPDKRFIPLDADLTCPNMKLGSLDSVRAALTGEGGAVVTVPGDIASHAKGSLEKMLEMSA